MRNRRGFIVGVLAGAITAACGGSPTASHAPTAKPMTSASGVEASATPSSSAAQTSTADIGASTTATASICRLPIVTFQPYQTGFISYPSGSFTPDPAGSLTSKGQGLAYDRGYSRWLPVDWRFVSDDGTHYVYETYSDPNPGPGSYSVIHLVTVATGADRVLTRSGLYTINDYVGDGIYLSAWVGGHDGPGPQIGWKLDPSTGGVQALSGGQKYGYAIGSGGGWREDYNPADPTVHQGMTGPNRLIRVDLATGTEQTWFYQEGADSVELLGFDRQGRPIVSSATGQVITLWLLPDSSHRSLLHSGSTFYPSAVADLQGIWFSNGSETDLYTPSAGLHKISSIGGSIAGGCH
jgi:hypothetical protein